MFKSSIKTFAHSLEWPAKHLMTAAALLLLGPVIDTPALHWPPMPAPAKAIGNANFIPASVMISYADLVNCPHPDDFAFLMSSTALLAHLRSHYRWPSLHDAGSPEGIGIRLHITDSDLSIHALRLGIEVREMCPAELTFLRDYPEMRDLIHDVILYQHVWPAEDAFDIAGIPCVLWAKTRAIKACHTVEVKKLLGELHDPTKTQSTVNCLQLRNVLWCVADSLLYALETNPVVMKTVDILDGKHIPIAYDEGEYSENDDVVVEEFSEFEEFGGGQNGYQESWGFS